MSILTDLKAALEAFMAAEDAYYGYDRSDIVLLARLLDEKMSTRSTLISRLLTGDTIAALIAVAEAVERESDCPLCGAETHTAGRRAVPEPHMPDCPLATLVKEDDSDDSR